MLGRPIALACRHARRQVGEERLDLGSNLESCVGFAHARQILLPRLLHDVEPLAQRLVEPLDGSGQNFRHDTCALAAAEHQEMQRACGVRR